MQPQYPGPYPGHHQQYLVNNSDPHRLSPQFFVQHPHYPYASPGLVWGPPHNGPALVGSHFVGVAHPGVYPQQHQWQTQIHHPQQVPHGLPPSPTHSTASIGNIVPQLDVHAFWKQRLAPLPGFCSAPDLFRNPGTTITQAPLPTPPTPPRSLNGNDHDTDDFFELDIHAESYIPQVLKDLQKAPHHFTPLSAVPIYPPASYHEDIPLSKSILKKYTISWSQCETLSRPPVHENIKLVSMLDDYQRHWLTLHAWELCKNADDKKKIILWKTKVHVVDWERSEFSIFVPGIRENYPRLELGDILHLKEVLEDWGEGTFMAFEGRVSLLKKREGHVHFYCPSLRDYACRGHPTPTGQYFGFHKGQPVPHCFNISFLANAGPAISMEIALRTIGTNLSERKTRSLVHRWMYPSPEDLQNNPPVLSRPPHTLGESWVDAGLNPEQRLAASSIALYQSPIPFLISGPPGTGKTRTIVETVHQILRFQPKAHILLCAPSNPATDTLVQRLGTVLAPREMLRLNDPNRTFAEIPDVIRPFCYVPEDDGKFALPPWKSLLKYRVVVTSCLDASMLVEAHLTNAVLGALEDDVMEALHPDDRKPVTPHFTHLLIDEAAQGSEPELLIPISVVYTRAKDLEDPTPSTPGSPGSGYHPLMTTPQLVLCGDSNQLGPIIMSDAARKHDLDVSLLERLFERPVYAKHPEARSKLVKTSNPPLVWQNSGLPNFKPFVNLTKNYRSHPAILMPPSAMFYNDSLEPCASNGLISWAGLPNQLFPVKVIGSYTKEDSVNEKATWYNPGEIERIVEVISELMEEATKSVPPLQAQDIGVMAPWREQVWKLRGALRKAGFAAVDVGSVEDFQGREKRVVIISCVRSTRKYLAEDRAKGIGLVYERKRMNVAITRAKELLVVVGNAGLLSKDPYWKGFLQFAMRNDLYVGPELKIENDGAWISRLESDLIRAQEESGLAKSKDSDDRNAMMLAGGIARDVLRDAEEWPPLPVR